MDKNDNKVTKRKGVFKGKTIKWYASYSIHLS